MNLPQRDAEGTIMEKGEGDFDDWEDDEVQPGG